MTECILLVQMADIGDLILSTPAIAALRQAKPEAHLALLTSAHAAPVVQGTNLVDEIITFDRQAFNSSTALLRPANLRRLWNLGRFDTVVYFHHFTLRLGTPKFALIALAVRARRRVGLDNGNGWFLTDSLPDAGFGAKHQAQYWLDLVGLLGAETTPRPAVVRKAPLSELALGGESKPSSLNPSAARIRIAIHPGSGGYSPARRWEAANFAVVADKLHKRYDAQIILVGGPNDNIEPVKAAMQHNPLDMSGATTLPQLAALLKSCQLFIGADSGVMHLAAAVGTPVVAIFGPSNAEAWRPWTPQGQAIVLRSGVACSPCSYVGQGIGLRDGCAAHTCLRLVTPDMVLRAVKTILSGEPVGEGLRPSLTAKPTFPDRVPVLGLPVAAITYDQWLALLGDWVEARRTDPPTAQARQVCTINPEFVMMAQRDPNFLNILNRAALCVPDGVGLLWAARYLGHPLPERVTGSDGVPKIAERAASIGWRLFFLGAAPGIAEQAAEMLRKKYPGVQIVGTYSGSPAPDEETALVEIVNASGADILLVAFGAPEQDKWIARNLPRLRVAMAMGVGGTFDFIAGIIPRAPLWMQRAGLEWLYRLYLQPWRIKRMMRLPRFVLAVVLRGRKPV